MAGKRPRLAGANIHALARQERPRLGPDPGRGQNGHMRDPVTVACVQAEPVILDRDATIEKLAVLATEAAGKGARLLVFPEAFIPAYPSSIWARALAGWATPGAKEAFGQLARESVEVPGPAERRLGEIA